jgi:hypothetical protein
VSKIIDFMTARIQRAEKEYDMSTSMRSAYILALLNAATRLVSGENNASRNRVSDIIIALKHADSPDSDVETCSVIHSDLSSIHDLEKFLDVFKSVILKEETEVD